MGKMVKMAHVGAFIELQNSTKEEGKNFRKITGDEFYEKFENKFIFPYQGLEDKAVLLPCGNDYCFKSDYDDEYIFDKDFFNKEEFKTMESKLSIDVKDAIDYLNCIFDGRICVNSGIVIYWDEAA
jgi:hypothetical protein